MPRPKINTEKTRINFYLPDKHLKALKHLAAKRGQTYSDLLRQAAYDYLVAEVRKEKGYESTDAA